MLNSKLICYNVHLTLQNLILGIYHSCYSHKSDRIYVFFECSAHPYLFFNPDQQTMTFIGFNIDKYSRSLVDQQTMVTLEKNIMSRQLWDTLRENNVPLQENFDDLSRYVLISL